MTSIDVYGGVGSRMDHSLANVQLMYRFLNQGISLRLMSHKNTLQLVNEAICLHGKQGDLVSIMPFSERATGVTTEGLYYSVTNGAFQLGDALGVSNYMVQETVTISVETGIILVIQARD